MMERFVLFGLVLSSVACFDSERPTFVEDVCEQVSRGPIDWNEDAAVYSLFEEDIARVRNLDLEPDEVRTIGVLKSEALTDTDPESIISDLVSAGLFWADRSVSRCQLSASVDGGVTSVQFDASFEVCTNYCSFEMRSVAIRIEEDSGLVQFVGTQPIAFD